MTITPRNVSFTISDPIKTTRPGHHISQLSLQWRHNGRDGISNHQPHDCLPIRLFGRRSKETSQLRVTGLCAENSPVTGPGHSPHKWPVTRKMFHLMTSSCFQGVCSWPQAVCLNCSDSSSTTNSRYQGQRNQATCSTQCHNLGHFSALGQGCYAGHWHWYVYVYATFYALGFCVQFCRN